ncbi:MAG: isoleucine--tRNA ligase [Clostridiales bacterium]|nr:isoleucine--tRNA ligase [Clostridiales bacterium]
MYQKVPTDLRFAERELSTLAFWREQNIFEKCTERGRGKEPFTFYDGPPTANGKPHIGHVLTRSIKDVIPRYHAMKGRDVLRKAGWDTHGLPVELEVEKELGLNGKEQIEAYGVEPFIKKCKESVWKYKAEWEEMSERVGFFADMNDPYVTYHDAYIESVWWSIKTIHEKGLLYKGHKTVPYCPRCGTALSSHEVAQGYKDVTDTSATAKFYLADGSGAAILAWTTTPWTLPSNVALCVNAKKTYCRVRVGRGLAPAADEVYILAEALVPSVLGEGAEVLETFKGSDLVGTRYLPLFDLPVRLGGKEAYRVISDDYVSLEDGTGVVHIAPAFGEDDNRLGKKWALPFVQLVDATGCLCGGTPWDGDFVKEADPKILQALADSNKLFSTNAFDHSYPFCWRCDTPLLYYARESWFIQMTAVRDKLIAFNRAVHWIPDTIKEGRMGNFLENVIDWGVSRERYWGTPLPVWVCPCGKIHVIGSRAELESLSDDCPPDLELHKPYIDQVTVRCPDCGQTMKREPSVIDCWFDSGSMPFAQWHFPFENQDIFARRYPANFISEALDQTRGWFYTLLAIATCLFDETPFDNCIVMGHVCDMNGKKMSKHLGNVVNPWDVLNVQGADAVRWYFFTGSMPWLPSRFSPEAVSEYQRKFMGTLWNTYAFYILYADIDGFDPTKHALRPENLSVMDRWILSRLNTLIKTVDEDLEKLRITEAGRALQNFVDELSNWYVRRGRGRYWGADMTPDKEAAFMTLYTVLHSLTLLAAPFVPFITEQMYQNMVRTTDEAAPISVHLCDFPVADSSFIDPALEENMGRVLEIVTLGRSARNNAALKIRQPLACLYATGAPLPEQYLTIIAEELNVKQVTFVTDASSFISYRCKPQLKTLGPRHGKLLPQINATLAGQGIGDEIVRAHLAGQNYILTLGEEQVILSAEDVLVSAEQKQGFVSETDRELTVVLDTNLTPELVEEGLVRELTSKLQTMRKEAGFEVSDRIRVGYAGNPRIAQIFAKYGATIAVDTLAEACAESLSGYEKSWDINGECVTLSVERVSI